MKPPASSRPVPEWFLRELRAVDPACAIRWNEREQRWNIMRPRMSGEVPNALVKEDLEEREWWRYVCVWVVSEKDGSYRDLDMRVIHAMREADLHKRDWRVVLAEMEKREEELEYERGRGLREARGKLYDAAYRDAVGRVQVQNNWSGDAA